jgi:phosphatidylserine decarboxylase
VVRVTLYVKMSSLTGHNVSSKRQFHRVGNWLPENHAVIKDWLERLIKSVDKKKQLYRGIIEFDKSIDEFRKLIEGDPTLRMLASLMFDEVPTKPPYDKDPIGNKQVRDYEHMLELFNEILQKAPEWNSVGYHVGLVGFPFNAILDWPMATTNGYAFFLNKEVNKQLKKIMDVWTTFLKSPASTTVLENQPHAWFGDEALKALGEDGSVGDKPYTFEELYECKPNEPYHGFKSWDDFFTREFKPGVRPVAYADGNNPLGVDPNSVIVNACESTPFALQSKVQSHDKFWLKGQPYSAADILGDPSDSTTAAMFEDGTVYQAFLSPTTYHRWHSPINGEIKDIRVIEGTYYSEPVLTGFRSPDGPDPAAPDRAQGYITSLATRTVILFQAEGDIGLMAFVAVGMSEVSSCEVFKKVGDKVKKGDQIGTFHHGGSTHCLIFRRGLDLAWVQNAVPNTTERKQKNIPVNGALAFVLNKRNPLWR